MKGKKAARAIYSVVLTIGIMIHSVPAGAKALYDMPASGKAIPLSRNAESDSAKPSLRSKNDTLTPCDYCIDPCLESGRQKLHTGDKPLAQRYLVIDARVNYEAAQQPCNSERQDVEFRRGERVTVYVVNMNPFLYEYTITKSEVVLQETAQNIFLNRLGPLFSDFISSTGTLKSASVNRSDNCSRDIVGLNMVIDDIDKKLAKWKSDYAGFDSAYEEVRAVYNQLLDPYADCNKLCHAAIDYRSKFVLLPTREAFARLAAEVADAKNKLESDRDAVAQLRASLRDVINHTDEEKRLDRRIDISDKKIAALTDRIDRMKKDADAETNQDRGAALKQTMKSLQDERAKEEATRATLIDMREQFKLDIEGCDQRSLKTLLDKHESLLIEVVNLVDGINTLCAKLFSKANREKMTSMVEAIKVVFDNPGILLTQHFDVGTYREPTVVTINLTRTDRAKGSNTLVADSDSLPKPCADAGETAVRNPAPSPAPAPQTPAAASPAPAAGQQQTVKPPNPPVKPTAEAITQERDLPSQPLLAIYKTDSPADGEEVIKQPPDAILMKSVSTLASTSFFAPAVEPGAFDMQSGGDTTKPAGTTPPATPATPATPQNPNDAPKYERKLRFGIQSFSLSGGIVFSRLERQSFIPVLGIPLDRQGNPTGTGLVSVVGFGDLNRWTVGPVLLLNTLIIEDTHGKFGLHGSVGITGKKTDNNTDIDYFFGPSINFLGRRLFFTPGVYVGKQQRLGGDAYIGAPLGSLMSVPTRTENHARFGFSVTFRILPYPGQ